MKVSERLREQIADQMIYALCPESGVSPTDAFSRIIFLIETSSLTADALPTDPRNREPVKVRLGEML